MANLSTLTSDLAARLRETREALCLSQAEAARALGVSERAYQGWELGEAWPRPLNRRAIAVWLERHQGALGAVTVVQHPHRVLTGQAVAAPSAHRNPPPGALTPTTPKGAR